MSPSTNKPVLITGAATPLGHEVARTLLAAGREVVALIDETDTESLTAVELEAEGARYAFAVGHGRTATIGRAGDDAQFEDPAMSGCHFRIVDEGSRIVNESMIVVRDLGSTNGTLIDGAAAPRFRRTARRSIGVSVTRPTAASTSSTTTRKRRPGRGRLFDSLFVPSLPG